MSPETIAILLTALGTLLKMFDNEVKNKARQDDSHAALLENDKKQRARIDQFTQSIQDETVRQDKTIEKLSNELRTALLDKAEQKGQLKELIRNQGIDRDKLDALSKRISELETDNKFKTSLIERLTKERDSLRKQLSDSSDMVSAKTLQIAGLEAKLLVHNGTEPLQTTKISGLPSNRVETTISNVQTAVSADNSIDEEKESE